MPHRSCPAWWLALVCAVAVSGCSSLTGPSGPGPTVNAITPATGSTFGGTTLTILGGGFASGVTVTVGGAPATDVTVSGTTTITATTPQHAAGAADVVVTLSGLSTTLSGAFTYVTPTTGQNVPPTIVALTAKGTLANEPSQYANKGETINVTATVTDPETPSSGLAYAWTSDGGGTFAGTGSSVTWTAPASVPAAKTVTLKLVVTETYTEAGSMGLPVTATNTATKTVTVSLHDSVAEVGAMAVQFLEDFSHSDLSTSYVLRNFTDTCRGKQDEASDVDYNRATYLITAWQVGLPSVTTGFGAGCPLHHVPGDSCANVHVSWTSTTLADGSSGTVTGTDQVSAIYLTGESRWALCGSDWQEDPSLTTSGFSDFMGRRYGAAP